MNDSTMKMARRTIYRSTAQKLTDGMRGFLERQSFAMLGTYNPDGLIHMVTLSYIFEDGRFFGDIVAESQSAQPRGSA